MKINEIGYGFITEYKYDRQKILSCGNKECYLDGNCRSSGSF